MFEDSVLEAGDKKAGTMFISMIVHVGLLAILILIPLIYTEALPAQEFILPHRTNYLRITLSLIASTKE